MVIESSEIFGLMESYQNRLVDTMIVCDPASFPLIQAKHRGVDELKDHILKTIEARQNG